MKKKFNIKSYDIDLKKDEIKYVFDCLKKNQIANGDYKEKFEKSIKKITKSKYAIACANGTAALFLSLKLAGVKKNDEVIVPAFSFIASINAVKYNNAHPIFMDVDEFHNIDEIKTINFLENHTFIKNKKTFNKKTKRHISAIVIVHMWGRPANFSRLYDLAKKYNIEIIEDAAEALGSKYTKGKFKNKFVGTLGKFGCLSFNANKIITSGGGGMILTNSKKSAGKINHLITQAKKDKIYFVHDNIGYNLTLSNLHCAIGFGQSLNFKKILLKKKKIYDFYRKHLSHKKNVSFLEEPSGSTSNKWMNIITLKKNINNHLINKFRKKKIDARGVWYPCNLQKMYINNQKFKLSNVYKISRNSICLPSGPNLTLKELKRIIKLI